MKKSCITALLLFVSVFIKAQLPGEYSSAIEADRLSSVNTIRITGKTTAMGMEKPMTMFLKNHNKSS